MNHADPNKRVLRGLYVITDEQLIAEADLVSAVGAAIAGGAALVQYRDKHSPRARRLAQAGALLDLCRSRGVPLIINDDVELARRVAADGVHVGRDDAEIHRARQELGAAAMIGVSCYNDLERARAAQQAGADYVAFGSFFPSSIKPGAVRAHPTLLEHASAQFQMPIAAIGGIEPENGRFLLRAGADMLAVISGVFGQPDIEQAARRYARLFTTPEGSGPGPSAA